MLDLVVHDGEWRNGSVHFKTPHEENTMINVIRCLSQLLLRNRILKVYFKRFGLVLKIHLSWMIDIPMGYKRMLLDGNPNHMKGTLLILYQGKRLFESYIYIMTCIWPYCLTYGIKPWWNKWVMVPVIIG